jgi:hypothetical protein
MNPFSHVCDIGTIDYSLVDEGTINCTVCGKTWTLDIDKGWKPDPIVSYKPGTERPQTTYKPRYKKAKPRPKARK